MRLGIDLDDCVVNTFEVDLATCYLFSKEKGLLKKSFYKPNSSHAPKTFNMNSKDDNEFFAIQRKKVIEQDLLKPKFLAKNIINKLFEENYEIYFLTGRQDKYWGDASKESAKWLKKNALSVFFYGFDGLAELFRDLSDGHSRVGHCQNLFFIVTESGPDVFLP